MSDQSCLPLDERAARLVSARLARIETAAKDFLSSDTGWKALQTLRAELEAVDDARAHDLCSYCRGTGIDDDPGMTRYYSEKSLGRSWKAPAGYEFRSFSEQAAGRKDGIRLLNLIDRAWDVIGDDGNARQFACHMLANAIEREIVDPHVDICTCCDGSGLANEADYTSGWARRQGWQKTA